jgi:hypothetical protein
MSAPISSRLDDAILRAGRVDYLDFWFIAHVVEDMLGTRDESIVQRSTLEALERLLYAKRLRVGDLRPPGEFEPWPLDANAALSRIRDALAAVDRPLQVGDIAWFEVLE